MTTVDVPGVIIPSCHILHEQILCSATMAYNILGLCKCAIIAIYHIGVGYTVVRSAVEGTFSRPQSVDRTTDGSRFLVSVIQTWI